MLTDVPREPSRQATAAPTLEAVRVQLSGRVQGLGVRPAIYKLAIAEELSGSVGNTLEGVEIRVQGRPASVARFLDALLDELPAGAAVERMATNPIPPISERDEFRIDRTDSSGPLATRVPVDLALCPDCEQEIESPFDRRCGYAFTSCTACGPRYSILRSLPYERADTAMDGFALCAPCAKEYHTPGDRRFHAQTNACVDCGPECWTSQSGRVLGQREQGIKQAAVALDRGEILGLRGLGGYQLLVDARNSAAVERLRQLKGRPTKPMAVLVDSLESACRLAGVDEASAASLTDPSNPIVLLPAKRGELAESVSRGFATLGLMLPTTPLHRLLLAQRSGPLVCTSGNREGNPLEYTPRGAERHLAAIADLFLHHNREIIRPIDDSVVRIIAGRRTTLRLARGLAPAALPLPTEWSQAPAMVALGGHLKSAVAWWNGRQAALGPHLGDQQGLRVRERTLAHLANIQQLYRFEAEGLIHDLHPEYFTTQWAESQRLRRATVQHHHAHIVAGMLEAGWLDRTVLGVAWDGTGYGLDNTIWGGEFLLATACRFRRLGRLRPLRLPGGEAAIKAPWRVLWGLLGELPDGSAWRERTGKRLLWEGWTGKPSRPAIATAEAYAPWTSSGGRLFDAAAALIGNFRESEFDAAAAMRLESLAEAADAADIRGPGYRFPTIEDKNGLELDWRPLLTDLLEDWRQDAAPPAMALRFHQAAARGIAVAIRRLLQRLPEGTPVVFGGGVFQNRLLVETLIVQMTESRDVFSYAFPAEIPPGDGGLAAGQLAVGMAQWHQTQGTS